jgi:hypothetical protein
MSRVLRGGLPTWPGCLKAGTASAQRAPEKSNNLWGDDIMARMITG